MTRPGPIDPTRLFRRLIYLLMAGVAAMALLAWWTMRA